MVRCEIPAGMVQCKRYLAGLGYLIHNYMSFIHVLHVLIRFYFSLGKVLLFSFQDLGQGVWYTHLGVWWLYIITTI